MGRDLPTDQALAAFAHVNARARQYRDSGAFPGERVDRLRATAYLDILNDLTADDRIAYGRLGPDDPDPDPGPDADALEEALDDDGPGAGPGPGGPSPGPATTAPAWAGRTAPATSATAAARRPTTAASPATTTRAATVRAATS